MHAAVPIGNCTYRSKYKGTDAEPVRLVVHDGPDFVINRQATIKGAGSELGRRELSSRRCFLDDSEHEIVENSAATGKRLG